MTYIIGRELCREQWGPFGNSTVDYYSETPLTLPCTKATLHSNSTQKYMGQTDVIYDVITLREDGIQYYRKHTVPNADNAVIDGLYPPVSNSSKAPFIHYPTYTRSGKYPVAKYASGVQRMAPEMITDSVVLIPLMTDVMDEGNEPELRWRWYVSQLNEDSLYVQRSKEDVTDMVTNADRKIIAPPEELKGKHSLCNPEPYTDKVLLCRYMILQQCWIFMALTHEQAKEYIENTHLLIANGRFDKSGVFRPYEVDLEIPQCDEDRVVVTQGDVVCKVPLNRAMVYTSSEDCAAWENSSINPNEEIDIRVELTQERNINLTEFVKYKIRNVYLHPYTKEALLTNCNIENLYINSARCRPCDLLVCNARIKNIYYTNMVSFIGSTAVDGGIAPFRFEEDDNALELGTIHISASVTWICEDAFEPLADNIGLLHIRIAKRGLLAVGSLAFMQCDLACIPQTLRVAGFAAFYDSWIHGTLTTDSCRLQYGTYMDCRVDSKDEHAVRSLSLAASRGLAMYSPSRGFWYNYLQDSTLAFAWYARNRWLSTGTEYLRRINDVTYQVIHLAKEDTPM